MIFVLAQVRVDFCKEGAQKDVLGFTVVHIDLAGLLAFS